jgi:hypothetical protein
MEGEYIKATIHGLAASPARRRQRCESGANPSVWIQQGVI